MAVRTPERIEYYARIGAQEMSPLWEVNKRLVPPKPVIASRPHVWDYQGLRSLLMESGPLITAKEAQRRVLILENPGLDNSHRATESLFAGLQLLLPGEIAPAHRHSPAALRFLIEGEGAYTSVSGEKTVMRPGDFIITPSMTWHDHGHEGTEPVVWMDGLDIPVLQCFGPMFFEQYPDDQFPAGKPAGDSLARYGANMRPVTERWERPESPIFSYPYERSREALEALRTEAEWDPWFGLKLQYVDPTKGGPAMPTISTYLQLLPKGFRTETYRTTEGSVYAAIEGEGRALVETDAGTVTLAWKPKDIFVIPCWMAHRLEAGTDSVLFSFSDRAAQEKLGIWAERRGNA
jgi:gentisate 1,2-dioxygenase